MAKVLFSLDAHYYSENLIRIVESLIKHSDKLPDLYTGIVVYDGLQGSVQTEKFRKLTVKRLIPDPVAEDDGDWEESQTVNNSIIEHFTNQAAGKGVNCELHWDQGAAVEEIIKETYFADILVAGIDKNLLETRTAFNSLSLVIKFSQCSLLLVPSAVAELDNIILVYDGTLESVGTIKNFALLCKKGSEGKKVTLLTVFPSSDEEIKRERMLLELVKSNFANLGVLPVMKEDLMIVTREICRELFSPLLVVKDVFSPGYHKQQIASELLSWEVPLFISRN